MAKRENESVEDNGRYEKALHDLQVELVKFQRHLIAHGHRVLVLIEGRDAAGKDGLIKRFVEHLSPRETRVVALSQPSDHDRRSWYFQRYVSHLPAAQEMVVFNRSWYNRAGVERVLGFCTKAEYAEFMDQVVPFEHMLIRSGIQLFKYYLDISRDEQMKRLRERRRDPLKQWKTSAVDAVALDHWHDYSRARNDMLVRTHESTTPWYVVRADRKKVTRLNVMAHFLATVDCPDKDEHLARYDAKVVRAFSPELIERGELAR